MGVSLCGVCTQEYKYLGRRPEVLDYPGVIVTGGCEPSIEVLGTELGSFAGAIWTPNC